MNTQEKYSATSVCPSLLTAFFFFYSTYCYRTILVYCLSPPQWKFHEDRNFDLFATFPRAKNNVWHIVGV